MATTCYENRTSFAQRQMLHQWHSHSLQLLVAVGNWAKLFLWGIVLKTWSVVILHAPPAGVTAPRLQRLLCEHGAFSGWYQPQDQEMCLDFQLETWDSDFSGRATHQCEAHSFVHNYVVRDLGYGPAGDAAVTGSRRRYICVKWLQVLEPTSRGRAGREGVLLWMLLNRCTERSL